MMGIPVLLYAGVIAAAAFAESSDDKAKLRLSQATVNGGARLSGVGPLQMPRPPAAASGYRGAAVETLTIG
jgi:hypothetical protein